MENITEYQYNEAKRIIKLYKTQLITDIHSYSKSDIYLPIEHMTELNNRMLYILKNVCKCITVKDVLLLDATKLKPYRDWGKGCNDLLIEIQKKYNINE